MFLEGRCIECGAAKIQGDLDYDKWGGCDIGGGCVLLCPYHYAEHVKNEKKLKRQARRFAYAKIQLEKIFPEVIKWIEGEGYREGQEMARKMVNLTIFHRIRRRMEDILKSFEETKVPLSEREREHVKEILFEKCYICKYWDEQNFCRASNTGIVEAVKSKMEHGNYGCEHFQVQISMDGDLSYYGEKVRKWKRENAKMRIPW